MVQEGELLEKIDQWQAKAKRENDPFDKYVSMFIAYNIFYNLYAAKKNPNRTDFQRSDSKRAVATTSLIEADQLLKSVESDLRVYLLKIPVFTEEYWPWKGLPRSIPIAQTLKESFRDRDAENTIDLLIKWLYKVRCNLVHGEKSYQDTNQRILLNTSAKLLDEILTHLVSKYKQTYR